MRASHPRASRGSKATHNRKYRLWIAFAVIIVLAIVIPIAIMFGKKKKTTVPRSGVLVPLYVYPSPGAWDPLYNAISGHPRLEFTIVVNPASGPGTGSGPDGNYTREIPRLNAFANVRTVGYVSTNYTNRDLDSILGDISTYSAWSENATAGNLSMHGIFLDETPAIFNDASASVLETISTSIMASPGLGHQPLIIHNPGMIPDIKYLSSCNVTVVFEGAYSTFQTHSYGAPISVFLANSTKINNAISRDNFAVILHGVPSTLSDGDESTLVNDARKIAGQVFMTGLDTDYYAGFWQGWDRFLQDMD